MRFEFPEDALEPSHPARVLWDVLGKMELGAFSKGCKAVEGRAGRSLKSGSPDMNVGHARLGS